MNKQLIFDTAYKGLAAQGFQRSVAPGEFFGGCRYRGGEGRKCAVGHLIPDDRYYYGIEGKSVNDREVLRLIEPSFGVSLFDHCFLTSLQRAHDEGTMPELMQEALKSFAREYKLTIPEVPDV